MDTIFEGVMKSEAGRSMTLERVRGSLIQLGCAPGVRGATDTYSVGIILPSSVFIQFIPASKKKKELV